MGVDENMLVRLLHNLTVLQEEASLLASTASLKEIAQRSLHIVADALGATAGVLRLYEEVHRRLRLVATYGSPFKQVQQIPNWEVLPLRPGVLQTLIETPGALVVEDVLSLDLPSDTRQLLIEEGVHALAGVALRARGRLVGTLTLYHPQPGYFHPDASSLLEVLGSQVALALENWRLHQGLDRRLQVETSLRQIVLDLLKATRRETLLTQICHYARELTGAATAAFWLLTPSGEHLELVAGEGLMHLSIGHRVRVGEGATGLAVQEGRIVKVADYSTWPHKLQVVTGDPPHALIVIPFRDGERVVGTLTAAHTDPNATFTAEDQRLLNTLADMASLVYRDVRLLEEAERRTAHLQRVLRITEIATSSLDLDTLLPRFADALVAHLNVTECFIALYDDRRDLLFPAAASSPYNEIYQSLTVTRETPAVTRRVLQTLQPEVVEDVFHSPWIDPEIAHHFPTKSLLAVPMIAQGKPLGAVLVGESRHHRRFTPEEIREVSVLGAQIALAIRHAQVHEMVRRQAEDLGFLYDVAVTLMTLHSAREMAMYVVEALDSFFPDVFTQVFVYNPHTGRVELVAVSKSQHHRLEELYRDTARFEKGEGLIGTAYTTGQVVRVDDVRHDPRYIPFYPETRSEMCVPLTIRGRTIGVLDVQSPQLARCQEREERVVCTLATGLAAALENARLYAELESRARLLQQAYEELQVQDHYKDEFIQNLSHELRNPMTFVKGYAEFMLEEGLGPITEDQREALEIIRRRSDDMVALLTEILELHRGDLDQVEWEKVDLRSVLITCLNTTRVAAEEAQLRLSWDVPASLPHVAGSSRRLRQVFDNLLSNAIKFTPAGRTIAVRAWSTGDEVVVAVTDEGIGIPQDQLQRIFERFYQVKVDTPRQDKGAGLGLAITRRIVEAHKGRIWAESQVGKGSTFYVALPVLNEEACDVVDRQVLGTESED